MHSEAEITSAPVLEFPRPNDIFLLDTDASDIGIGGVHFQKQRWSRGGHCLWELHAY